MGAQLVMEEETRALAREPKYPPIKDGDQVAYLLLHVGVPAYSYPARSVAELKAVKSAQEAGEVLGIRVWPIRVTWQTRSGGEYRYFFRFRRFRRDDQRAQEIAECFFFALSLAFGPCLGRNEEAVVFRVPADLVRRRRVVAADELVQVEEARLYEDRTLESPEFTFGSVFQTSEGCFDAAWRATPILVRDEKLHRAVRFLKASQDDFYVWPGQVFDVLANPTATALSGLEQSALENALQNAFKAVEAVLGDPPTKHTKFRAKMEAMGLDPDEEVGYGEKAPLQTVLRNMSDARDHKAAHGSTRHREITVGELMEYQACARLVVWVAIEHTMGEPICP